MQSGRHTSTRVHERLPPRWDTNFRFFLLLECTNALKVGIVLPEPMLAFLKKEMYCMTMLTGQECIDALESLKKHYHSARAPYTERPGGT